METIINCTECGASMMTHRGKTHFGGLDGVVCSETCSKRAEEKGKINLMVCGSMNLLAHNLPPFADVERLIEQVFAAWYGSFMKKYKVMHIGDAPGTDEILIDYMSELRREIYGSVTIFHKGSEPRLDPRAFMRKGGYESYVERDDVMIQACEAMLCIRAGGESSRGATRNIKEARKLGKSVTVVDI